MEKKKAITILLVLFCFLLTGCSSEEAESVDSAIMSMSIGTVSLEEADTVRKVRESYDALSEKDKSKVENEALLQAAEKTLAGEVIEKIDNIERVDLNSGGTIKEAQNALDMLPENARQFVPDEKLDMLNKAAKEYSDLLVQSAREMFEEIGDVGQYRLDDGFPQKVWDVRRFYNELPEKERVTLDDLAEDLKEAEDEMDRLALKRMQELTQWDSNYEKAVDFAESYFDGRVNLQDASMELLEICSDSVVKLSDKQIQDGKLEAALRHLEKCVESYPDPVLKEANELYDNILADLEKRRPESGLLGEADESWNCKVTIMNDSEQDILLKLLNEYFQESILIYVRAGEKAAENLENNEYYARFATGSHWYSEEELFGTQTEYFSAKDSAKDYIVKLSAEIPTTIKLKPPVEGENNPDRIDASDF